MSGISNAAQLFAALIGAEAIAVNFSVTYCPSVDWQPADGGPSPPGSLETQPFFSMRLIPLLYPGLAVIGSLSSSLSYYISPLGYPTHPWEHFTLRAGPGSPRSVGHARADDIVIFMQKGSMAPLFKDTATIKECVSLDAISHQLQKLGPPSACSGVASKRGPTLHQSQSQSQN
ncbi:unnamed protein product [Pleuronectes platessa]|uniref:Uncharacterized protein n=1 Tax=Pleuronectes platessa TaxID=8262 RepID=A0A9N7YT95_PLEPL|nr:unnamed protein product [Pleuronectes platessa]